MTGNECGVTAAVVLAVAVGVVMLYSAVRSLVGWWQTMREGK